MPVWKPSGEYLPIGHYHRYAPLLGDGASHSTAELNGMFSKKRTIKLLGNSLLPTVFKNWAQEV